MSKPKIVKMKKKDRFSLLEDDFKAEVEAMDKPEIDKKIADWAKLIEATTEEMKDDDDLASKREAARLACAPYYEDIKMAKLRIAFAMRILTDRGSK
jgi:hypothetical protein